MDLTPQWRLLTSSLKVTGSPTLLIKHEIEWQENGYLSNIKVYVTDLTFLWKEVIERKAVYTKALETPIDPIVQLDKVLEHLSKGLTSAPDSTLSLRSEKGRSHLVLHLTCPLPEGNTKKFEWDFDLRQASASDFTREFVLPLVGNLYDSQRAVENLKEIIADKDRAIQRIDTGLKTHNKEIVSLFDKRFFGEHAPEKHKKSILMNKLPGFRPFEAGKWQTTREAQDLPKERDLNKHVFENGLTVKVNSDSVYQVAGWWEDLVHAVEVDGPSQISQPVVVHRPGTSGFDSSQVQDENIRAGTNRHAGLRSSSPIESRLDNANSNGEEEDSDATASTVSDFEPPAPDPPLPSIGRLGGSKSKSRHNENVDTTRPAETSESRSDPKPAEVEANESRPRGGIGKIGGLRRPQGVADDSAASPSQSENMPARPAPKPANANHLPEREPERESVPETAEQRADKQRQLLKHDLEEKRKAPVKKKRKF